ncbi:hypothetical protein K5I29_10575 [Flavobacterium agricola]|uniref:Uncharacterized protein n=1 Tax=Flavobacterium agricola TaxID=2870839 RepID=A0ABY6LX75_9FLAO|nr:hypothetical protein [Flavobacterium agricola]UYW00937.1 hypothetical protein K5I29_10575 [Flavobacterium agricola]
MVMKKSNNSLLDRLNEPQILFTILYVVAIAIGMIFNFAKYKAFHVNIFDYCDITDFILFPFSDFKIILFTLVIAILCLILYYVDLRLRDYFPNFFKKSFVSQAQYKTISFCISICMFVLFIFIVSQKYSKNFYNNIELAEDLTIYTKTETFKGKYIGKTSDVLFMYQNRELKIFPITSNITYYEIN